MNSEFVIPKIKLSGAMNTNHTGILGDVRQSFCNLVNGLGWIRDSFFNVESVLPCDGLRISVSDIYFDWLRSALDVITVSGSVVLNKFWLRIGV